MNLPSAYAICRDYNEKYGEGTAAQIALKIGLTSRTGFASQLAVLWKDFKYLDRRQSKVGSKAFSYRVQMIPGKGKNKNKMFIDTNSPGEEWLNQANNIEGVDYWNAHKPRTLNRESKKSPQLDMSLDSDMIDVDTQALYQINLITKRAAANRVLLKNCIKGIIQTSIDALLKQGEIVVPNYSDKKRVSVDYEPYDSKRYVIEEFNDMLDSKPTHEEKE